MTTAAVPNLKESALLELEGSTSRLMVALQALADFESQNVVVVGDAHGLRPCSPELSASLEKEYFALLLEHDSARRAYKHALDECLRLGVTPPSR
jgi:hypothetical protein